MFLANRTCQSASSPPPSKVQLLSNIVPDMLSTACIGFQVVGGTTPYNLLLPGSFQEGESIFNWTIGPPSDFLVTSRHAEYPVMFGERNLAPWNTCSLTSLTSDL